MPVSVKLLSRKNGDCKNKSNLYKETQNLTWLPHFPLGNRGAKGVILYCAFCELFYSSVFDICVKALTE